MKKGLILAFVILNDYMALLHDITLGQFYPGNSFVHRLDPRSKLVTGMLLMTSSLVVSEFAILVVGILMCVGAWVASGIPFGALIRNLMAFFWLFLITMGVHVFTTPGDVLVSVPLLDWSVTVSGISKGVFYTLRLTLLLALAALLTLSTSPLALTDGLERLLSPLKRLKVPVHDFALMVTLTLRFVPILLRQAERVKNAQLSRGASLDGPVLQRIRTLVPMVLPLFVSALRRADELAIAMEARHYSGDLVRTSYHRLVFKSGDYLVMAGATGFAVFAHVAG